MKLVARMPGHCANIFGDIGESVPKTNKNQRGTSLRATQLSFLTWNWPTKDGSDNGVEGSVRRSQTDDLSVAPQSMESIFTLYVLQNANNVYITTARFGVPERRVSGHRIGVGTISFTCSMYNG